MNVIYGDKAKQSGERFNLLQQATRRLEEDIWPSSANSATVEWDQVDDDKGQSLFNVKIRHDSTEVSTSLDLEELKQPSQARYRLLRLWGELLKIESHQILDNLKKISRED